MIFSNLPTEVLKWNYIPRISEQGSSKRINEEEIPPVREDIDVNSLQKDKEKWDKKFN